ncbi:hypothetical protein ES332_A09G218400v1 [Gossypium tomentosum]|nr:hypothetical protein ES332_A09G218400v1 [Gossypium tomentosum]
MYICCIHRITIFHISYPRSREGRGLRAGFTADAPRLLHMSEPLRRTAFNRLFAVVYFSAILALLYRHVQNLFLHPTTSFLSFSITLFLFISNLVLAFMWVSAQAFRMSPIRRKEFPQNLKQIIKDEDFVGLDVFICTADPYKEPPMNVVNTALSLMAYDYPTEKISIYVSDDGGSVLTLFAFMEAAKFARHWLPFCRQHNIMERSPHVYFESISHHPSIPQFEKIEIMYEDMKMKVEQVIDKGAVIEEYISDDQQHQAFNKWTKSFSRMDHPTVIQVILDKSKDTDISGQLMPNLIYVSREKSKTSPHHFKAGALNVLLRVSAVMTNAPIILTQDCDMYSNDPQTPLRILCYFSDPALKSNLAFVQFPQRFHGLNRDDIYATEYKRLFKINSMGFDGLNGPNYVGSGCFFRRRALFGGPSTPVPPKIPELGPDHVVRKPIISHEILSLAHRVAGCNYENQTGWGSQSGFRYGSLVEDFYTGYRLQCEGWKSLFCNPERAAFLGDVPITLFDVLSQCKRWCIGLFEVAFSKYNTLIFGSQSMGITEPWFFLYVFLLLGAYGQDFLDFVLDGGTVRKWWNAQRMWMIRGLSCYLFSSIEYLLKSVGISTHGFSLTSKVVDDEQSKRYGQGIFEFGVPSPLFMPLTVAAIINLFSFLLVLTQFFSGKNTEGLCLQMILTGSIVLNCRPVYGAIGLRNDAGKMPTQITIISTFVSMMYEDMKVKVEHVIDKGEVTDEYITDHQQRQAFNKWTKSFTRMDHPTVIQLRVSAVMTNAPIILTQDCDMYSNDPQTPLRMLCYLSDPALKSSLAFIQFPQRFHGVDKDDIYDNEYKLPFQINPMGLDGLKGPSYVFCFFRRRSLFGDPSTPVSPEIPELSPEHVVNKPIKSQETLSLAHHVASCNYENETKWGSKISEPWFFLYVFLFLGSYGQDFLDIILVGGTVRRWWNVQRMWMIRGLTCNLFASIEYLLESLGISTYDFCLTSKVVDDEQSKRYGQGIFEFGVPSPLFVPLTVAAIINLFSFLSGLTGFFSGNNMEGLGLQMILTGFIVLNYLPVYGAIALRNDAGKMPTQIIIISTFVSVALYYASSLCLWSNNDSSKH